MSEATRDEDRLGYIFDYLSQCIKHASRIKNDNVRSKQIIKMLSETLAITREELVIEQKRKFK